MHRFLLRHSSTEPTAFATAFFMLMGLFFAGSAVHAFAQEAVPSSDDVQRHHLDLGAKDLQMAAKSEPGLRVDDRVSLKSNVDRATLTSSVIEAPFAFNGLAPHWRAETPSDAHIHVEVRTSRDGSSWTRWTPTGHAAPVEPTIKRTGEPNPYAGDMATGYVLTELGSRYVQFRVTLERGADTPQLDRISMYLVNSTGGPSEPSAEQNDAYNERIEQDMKSANPAKAVSKPRIYTRSEWGAQAPSGGYRYYTADHLGMHHSASTSDGNADTWSECAAAVRGIQDFHMYTNGWTDIGYNYVVCQTGHIFQGREDGDDGSDIVGAHDGANTGSVGVDGLGYFHAPYDQTPTNAMLDGFAELFAWIADRRGIDPSSASYYYGYGGTVDNVYGHRDVSATACPGDNLYTEIPTVISKTNTILDGGGSVTLTSDWQRNGASGGRPSWFSSTASTERGLAYGVVGGKERVYAVSRTGGLSVQVMRASDGADVTTLSTSGISGGVYALNDIEASSDGVLFAANLTTDASQSAFKVYRWDSESDTPTEVVSYSGAALRLGDHITVTGSTADNSIEIWAPGSGSNNVVRFATSTNGQSFTASTITVGSMGSTPSVGAFSQYFFLSSAGVGAGSYNDSGSQRGTVPASVIPSTTGSLKTYADFSGPSMRKYAAAYDYVSGSAHGGKLRLVDVTDGASSATLQDETPWLGGADNPNGTGDVAVKSNGDGTFTIFVLATNNGLAAYSTSTVNGLAASGTEASEEEWETPTAYPNPTSESVRIDVSLTEASAVRVEVFDILGRRVLSRDYGRIGGGERTFTVPVQNLASGAYLYRVKAGERTAEGSIRIVK
ncbi:DUF4623 domain-containing protein [Longibacter salinarum]|nr:DUF4623 domain-containing protein [Longibacter salinarum]